MLAARNRNGAPPTRFVGLAERHLDATHGADEPLVVGEDLDGSVEPVEFDAFLLRVMDFFRPRGTFRPAAAVDAENLLSTQPQANPHGVHRRVAGADHGDAAAEG